MTPFRAVAIIAICTLFVGCETLNKMGVTKPSASIKNVSFPEIGADSAILAFDVAIENPYPVALPLTNIDYSLTGNSASLLSGKAELNESIAARSSKVISIPIKISYMDLLSAFKGFRAGATLPYKAQLGLSVNNSFTGAMRLPLSKEGQLTVPNISTGAGVKDLFNKLSR